MFQIFSRSGCYISAVADGSILSASGGIPSGPAALPFLIFLMALMTSAFVGGHVFTCISSDAGGMSGIVGGGDLFNISSKC